MKVVMKEGVKERGGKRVSGEGGGETDGESEEGEGRVT